MTSFTVSAATTLRTIKIVHTIVWAAFAGCTVILPIAAWRGELRVAAWLAAVVAGEVMILALNRLRCPLTSMAARYTEDRRDNVDIYLPLWLAKYHKLRFGSLYVVGLAVALVRWSGR